jgi:uncharacterized protein (DUF2267 family)
MLGPEPLPNSDGNARVAVVPGEGRGTGRVAVTERWQWLSWRWPRELSTEAAVAAAVAIQSLAVPRRSAAVLVEVVGTGAGIQHRLRVPMERADQLSTRLHQAIPQAVMDWPEEVPAPSVAAAVSVGLTTGRRPLATERSEQVAAGVLSVLGDLASDEEVVIQWWLGPPRAPISLPSRALVADESWTARLWALLGGQGQPLDAATRRDLLDKQGRPGWRATGRVAGNRAAAARRRLQAVVAALRSAQAPGVQIRTRALPARRVAQRRLPCRWPVLVNVDELVALAAFPVGEPEALPLPRSGHRLLPLDGRLPRSGWTLGWALIPAPGGRWRCRNRIGCAICTCWARPAWASRRCW